MIDELIQQVRPEDQGASSACRRLVPIEHGKVTDLGIVRVRGVAGEGERVQVVVGGPYSPTALRRHDGDKPRPVAQLDRFAATPGTSPRILAASVTAAGQRSRPYGATSSSTNRVANSGKSSRSAASMSAAT